jgi:ligand-binding SRPBCC domain-containing protein
VRRFRHAFIIKCSIERVWDFYTDIKHLEFITPTEMQLRIIRATSQRLGEGAEVWLSGKLVTRSTWHSKVTYLKPYEYVDEMLSGRFKTWRHLHRFRKVGEDQTEVIDEIEFELPYGMLGKVFERYACRQLRSVFTHRREATIRALEG